MSGDAILDMLTNLSDTIDTFGGAQSGLKRCWRSTNLRLSVISIIAIIQRVSIPCKFIGFDFSLIINKRG